MPKIQSETPITNICNFINFLKFFKIGSVLKITKYTKPSRIIDFTIIKTIIMSIDNNLFLVKYYPITQNTHSKSTSLIKS